MINSSHKYNFSGSSMSPSRKLLNLRVVLGIPVSLQLVSEVGAALETMLSHVIV